MRLDISRAATRLLALALTATGSTVLVAVAGPAAGAAGPTSKVVAVQRSTSVTALLTSNGQVWTFGDDANGGTAQGTVADTRTPTPTQVPAFVADGEKVVQISLAGSGARTTNRAVGLALTDAGTVYSWGYGDAGARGTGATTSSGVPTAISVPAWSSDKPVQVLVAGGGGRVLTAAGHVYAWGDNDWGQTGIDNGAADISSPTEVEALWRPDDKVVRLSGSGQGQGGTATTSAITAGGSVLIAGSAARGVRGDGTDTQPDNYNSYNPNFSTLTFPGLGADRIVSLAGATSYYLAVSEAGKVYCWGFSQSGRCGLGQSTLDYNTPQLVPLTLADPGDSAATAVIQPDANISMLLTSQGNVYTAGSYNNGMQGTGDTAGSRNVFGKVTTWPGRATDDPVVSATVGPSGAFAVTRSGTVYAWGNDGVQGGIGFGAITTDTTDLAVTPAVLVAGVSPFTDGIEASTHGTVEVGGTVTASAGTYAPADAALSYVWKVGSETVSTAPTYAPVLADAGSVLTVTITAASAGYTDSVDTASAGTVATVRGFSGGLTEGQVLTADDASGSVAFVRYSDAECSTMTSSADGSTYQLPAAAVGQYVQVTQSLGARTGRGLCVGPVAAAAVAPDIAGPSNPQGIKGQPFSYALTTLTGTPAPAVSIVSGALPAGLTLDQTTGGISGVPTQAGDFALVLRASNEAGNKSILVVLHVLDVFSGLDPTISGTPQVGVQLTGSPGASFAPPASAGTTVTYQWAYLDAQLATWFNIPGANSATYTPMPEDVGHALRVAVFVHKQGFADDATASEATAVVAKGTFSVAAPSISGSAQVGEVLTCAKDPATQDTVDYRWTTGHGSVPGASYEVVPADVGETLSCVVTASRTGSDDATNQTDTAPVGLGTFTIGEPEITGVTEVGQTLTCVPADGTPPGGTFTWWREGRTDPVGGSLSYELKPADLGAVVSCRVTATRDGYLPAQAEASSPAVAKGSFTVPAPTITGAARVGEALTCQPDAVTEDLYSVSITWFGAGEVLLGTGPTYTPVASDVQTVVRCVATVARQGYHDAIEGIDSEQIAPGAAGSYPLRADAGPLVGATVHTALSGLPAGARVSWAWTVDGRRLVNWTGPAYRPRFSQFGQRLVVTVTVEVTGYEPAIERLALGPIRMGDLGLELRRDPIRPGQFLTYRVTNLAPGQRYVLRFAAGARLHVSKVGATRRFAQGAVRLRPGMVPGYGSRVVVVETRGVGPRRVARTALIIRRR